jgi:spore germination protein GerM
VTGGRLGPAAVALAVVAGLGASACGVPADGNARPIDASDLAIALTPLATTTTTTTTTTTVPPSTVPATTVPVTSPSTTVVASSTTSAPTTTTLPTTTTVVSEIVTVYLVLDNQLVPVEVRRPRPVSLADALTVLAKGADLPEAPAGTRSPIRPDLITGVSAARGVATIDLAPPFSDLLGQDQVLAVAQLVLTVTGRPGIGQVTFRLGGKAADVPRADGSVKKGNVTRDDYQALLAGATTG